MKLSVRRQISAIVAISAAAVVCAQGPRRRTGISNGIVVTVDGANRIIHPARLRSTGQHRRGGYRGRHPAARGRRSRPRSRDAGLVNTHTHRADVLFRGLADDLALENGLTKSSFRGIRNGYRRSSCARARGWRRSR